MPAPGEIHFMIELGDQPSETSTQVVPAPFNMQRGFWGAGCWLAWWMWGVRCYLSESVPEHALNVQLFSHCLFPQETNPAA